MGLVIHLDSQGSGTGTGWDGTVNTRNDLPVTIGSPVVGSIYLAKFPIKIGTGILSYTWWQSGLYIRDTDLGSLSDWRRLNTKVKFTDSEFAIVSSANTDKQVRFDSSGITGFTQRTLTFQDKDGTIALLSDITGGSTTLRNITTTDTFSTPNETLNCTSGTFTVNLPTAVGIQGVVYTLVNSGTGIITLDANGTETINGSETIEIKRQYLSRTVQSDGSNWIII
jgi:hypothetical protein